MKLLFVTPVFPMPPNTGTRIIALHNVRGLVARGHAVDLVALSDEPGGDAAALEGLCRRAVCIPASPTLVTLARGAAGLLLGTPWEVSRFSSRRMREAVARLAADGDYDAAIFQLSQSIQFRPRAYAGPALLAMEDPIVLKHQRMAASATSLHRRWLLWRAALLRRYERMRIAGFDRVMLINRRDLEDCRRIYPAARFEWVPYGIDLDAFPVAPREGRDDATIIITGNMYHGPNARAAVHFCRNIFPRVLQRVPRARLRLVGARPAGEVAQLASHPRIEVTGAVPDIAAHLRRAMVSACAVELRIGTQTKVLEAMASGTPVVTTTAGNHGIDGVSGQHLHVADDPIDFADRVVELLELRGWDAISAEARRYVEGTFSWSIGLTRLEQVLTDMVRERRGP